MSVICVLQANHHNKYEYAQWPLIPHPVVDRLMAITVCAIGFLRGREAEENESTQR